MRLASTARVVTALGASPVSMYRKLAAWESSFDGGTGACPLRTRWCAQIAVANWLVRRTDLRRLAARELSVASGSCMPRIATAAWSTRMGSVSRGMRAKARISASGMGRAAASSAWNFSRGPRAGSSSCQSR